MLFRSWKSMVAQDPAFEIWEEPEEVPDETPGDRDNTLIESLEGIREEIKKQGKVYLRSSTIAQSERESLKRMLEEVLNRLESQDDKPPIGLLQDLFPIADGLEEAINAAESLASGDSRFINWANGIRITYQRLLDLFKKWNIRQMESVGKPFDPHLHVAVDVEHTDEYPPNTVVAEQRKGYLLGNQVLRFAEVIVAKPGPPVEKVVEVKRAEIGEGKRRERTLWEEMGFVD